MRIESQMVPHRSYRPQR